MFQSKLILPPVLLSLSCFFLRLFLNQSSLSSVFLQHLSFRVVLDVTFYVLPLLGRIILGISLLPCLFFKDKMHTSSLSSTV